MNNVVTKHPQPATLPGVGNDAHDGSRTMSDPIRVMFVQSHLDFSPAAAVHRLIMRELDPERVEVHLVCESEAEAGPAGLRDLPNVAVKRARFLPSVYLRSRKDVARSAVVDTVPAMADLAGLI